MEPTNENGNLALDISNQDLCYMCKLSLFVDV